MGAMIPALTGLISVTLKNVSSYLCNRRNEAIKVVRALQNRQSQFKNMVSWF